jgi:hypothetical protein
MLHKVTTLSIPASGGPERSYDIARTEDSDVVLVAHEPPDAYGRPVAREVPVSDLVDQHDKTDALLALLDYIASYHGEVLQLRAELDRLSAAVSRSES